MEKREIIEKRGRKRDNQKRGEKGDREIIEKGNHKNEILIMLLYHSFKTYFMSFICKTRMVTLDLLDKEKQINKQTDEQSIFKLSEEYSRKNNRLFL